MPGLLRGVPPSASALSYGIALLPEPPAWLLWVEPEPTPDLATIVLAGDLDLTVTPVLADRLAMAVGERPRRLVLDMAQVSFLDCAAARLLFGAASRRPDDRPPVIRRPSRAVRQILALTTLGADCEVTA